MIELAVSGVYKTFGFTPVLKDASFEIYTGEHVGLVGRNGAGKTTLFNLILGKESPDTGTVSIRKGATLGYLEQIHQNTTHNLTAEGVLKEAFAEVFAIEKRLRQLETDMAAGDANLDKLLKEYSRLQDQFTALEGYSIDDEFNKIVNGFKLAPILDTPFNRLSGGEKTIVKLAALLLNKPDILLLDEPTNHLDIHMLEWLEVFLAKYQGTVLMISHDRYFLDKTTTKTILVESGVCDIYNGNYSYHLEEKERRLVQEFNEYKTQQRKIEAMEAAIKRYRQWGHEGDNEKFFIKAKELEKRLEKMEVLDDPRAKEIKLPLTFNTERGSKDVLTIKDLHFAYGNHTIFNGFDLNIYYGEKVCIYGNNGAGKSTLFKLILGSLHPSSGSIKLGASVNIGFIPQEITFPNEKASIVDAFREEVICLEGQARHILAKYYFVGDAVFKRVSNLSGGEKVLLKLAILIQKNVNFLILDEPTNHIDIVSREILEDALLDFKGTLMFISHDRYFIQKLAGHKVEIGAS